MSSAKPVHWPSILQLGLSLLASLGLLGFSGLSLLVGVIQLTGNGNASQVAVPFFMRGTIFLLAGILVLPSAWYAYRRLSAADREPSPPRKGISPWLVTLLVMLLLPLALLAGNWVARSSSLAWLLLPGISLLATTLPILWLVLIGKRGLPGGSAQRQWGLFAAGAVFNPLLIMILELLALLGMILVVIFLVAINPELGRDISTLAMRLSTAPQDAENILTILAPYLVKPAFLAAILAFISLLVPLIEEAFKPLGLWLLAGRRLTPAEGFVGGLISGAGFALFENLYALSGGGEDWLLLASSRITTALLHVLTTGLVGWALAHAWTHRRYLRLGLVYALAVLLHGVWNALAIAGFTLPQFDPSSQPLGDLTGLSSLAVIALGFLVGVNFMLYYTMNRRLQPASPLVMDQADPQPDQTLSLD